ncbi:hypothetical protein [Legionella spiritensis]|uniref:hypothetical protein n=1 Tax=Legionella spiritensis TaxID=452 RepID=UPI000F6E0886|nr:hypothetical protein [Legionella spiritensis]VEG92446.1 Uncharacterised protein [Legionella spiritensis]
MKSETIFSYLVNEGFQFAESKLLGNTTTLYVYQKNGIYPNSGNPQSVFLEVDQKHGEDVSVRFSMNVPVELRDVVYDIMKREEHEPENCSGVTI